MADIAATLGRRRIHFTDHALDRYWDRNGANELHGRKGVRAQLDRDLQGARWSRSLPGWARLSTWHRARAEGAIFLDDERAFIVNRNETGARDYVAVTYMEPVDDV